MRLDAPPLEELNIEFIDAQVLAMVEGQWERYFPSSNMNGRKIYVAYDGAAGNQKKI